MRGSLAALTLIALVPATFAATEVVNLAGDARGLSVLVAESSDSRIVLEYDLGSFRKTPVDVDGSTYYTIALGEESNLLEAGLPALPNICRSVIIPDDAEMNVRLVASRYTDFEDVPVAPSKGNLTRSVNPTNVPYRFDAFYESDAWYPSEVVSARPPYIMRDVRGMVIEVNPFQYNASTQTLRVYENVVVELIPVGPGRVNVLTQRPPQRSTEFHKIHERHFINSGESDSSYPWVQDGGRMLVICHDDPDFLAEIQSLVDWKNQMGVPCELVTVTEAGGTAANIDSYIEQYYNAKGLTYVLLVGDAAQVPSLSVSDLSDPSYSLITADNYPDLFIGRFSAEIPEQVATQARRTVDYEKRPQASADWYHKGTGVASNLGPGDDGEDDDEHQNNIRTDLLAFNYTEVDQIYDPSGTAQMVSDALNAGRSIINYAGHGSTISWSSTGFSNTDVNALTNDNMLAFGLSVACENGDFDGGTCFGESWLRATNGPEPTGAIGFYASTISQSWDPPMDAQDEIVDLLVGASASGINRTFGGLCFNGCGHMMDEYGSVGESEFLHWTVFGDPSLRVRTDTPTAIDVTHLPVIQPGMTTLDVSVNTPTRDPVGEALCSLYGGGVIYGTAVTDSSGDATIPISPTPPVGDPLTLTVTAFNAMTYTADVHVVVPGSYDVTPSSVPVNATTWVTVTVWDGAGIEQPGVEITIDGRGITPQVDTSDALGEAHFSVTAAYGEDLTVVGREIGESYYCFEGVLPVTGAATLTSPDVDASTASIGLSGSLTPLYEGSISGTAGETGFTLYAVGCGVDAHAHAGGGDTAELTETPTSAGTIHAAIAKSGYDVYLEDIEVDVARGRLAGEVYETTREPIEGARVKGHAAGADTSLADPVFSVLSGEDGAYAVEDDLEVGYYDVYVLKFGYEPRQEEVFVQCGANDSDYSLDVAPSGVVSGIAIEMDTGLALRATVRVYRADNIELCAEVSSDTLTGGHYEVALPYFNYIVDVRAHRHITESRPVTMSSAARTENFLLVYTPANILVVDDGPGGHDPFKTDKNGVVPETSKGPEDESRSAAEIAVDLVDLGYEVTEETSATTNAATWLDYDVIVWSCGDNMEPVSVAGYRADLESYVANGGKLLIEGGELAYDSQSFPGYPSFCADVLHVLNWEHDSSGDLGVYDPAHPVTTFPNTLGDITFNYVSYGDQDSGVPTSDAVTVCDWSSHPGRSGVIVYDDTPDPASGQIVFYGFDYLAGEPAGMKRLLENTVVYLATQESAPTGVTSGQVCLEGEVDTPTRYLLAGAFPNPFNPTTEVSYGMPAGGNVALRVYDVSGRLLRTLVDGEKGAGYHTAVWDGRDGTGAEVASGVYFCRMRAEAFRATTKMVLLK